MKEKATLHKYFNICLNINSVNSIASVVVLILVVLVKGHLFLTNKPLIPYLNWKMW